MTVQTTKGSIAYVITTTPQDTFAYDFLVLLENDLKVFLYNQEAGTFIVWPEPFIVENTGNPLGGQIVLSVPTDIADEGKFLVMVRLMEPLQPIDYTAHDAFPAETHERGLDRLTLLIQQAGLDSGDGLATRDLRIPIIEDPADFNLIFPTKDLRANNYMFFDADGNATIQPATPPTNPGILGIGIQDDSTNHLDIDNSTPTIPLIGTKVNGPNNLVALDSTGKIPPDLINFSGLRALGFYRGDDLCPKLGDGGGDCIAPDTRNPSQRFPDNISDLRSGDYFVITMEAPEVNGTMLLFEATGQIAPSVIDVEERDGIIFFFEIKDDQDAILVYEGWYLIKQIVSVGTAADTTFDDTGNVYVNPAINVQIALDLVDAEFQVRDAYFLTKKTNDRAGLDTFGNLDNIPASGIYTVLAGDTGNPSGNPGTVILSINPGPEGSQLFIDSITGAAWSRGFQLGAGSWGNWTNLTNVGEGANFVNVDGSVPMTGNLVIANNTPAMLAIIPVLGGLSFGVLPGATGGIQQVNVDGDLDHDVLGFIQDGAGILYYNGVEVMRTTDDGNIALQGADPTAVNHLTRKDYVDAADLVLQNQVTVNAGLITDNTNAIAAIPTGGPVYTSIYTGGFDSSGPISLTQNYASFDQIVITTQNFGVAILARTMFTFHGAMINASVNYELSSRVGGTNNSGIIIKFFTGTIIQIVETSDGNGIIEIHGVNF